ncbi:MAG: PEP-CTERM sorting domain-containing protein [Planctomycetota bacterium]
MINRVTCLAAASAVMVATGASAAILTADPASSGRYQSNTSAGDYTFGNPLSSAGRVVGGAVPRVGTNGSGAVEFLGVYGYEITADFAADINGGGTASIQIGTGAAAPNIPASIDLYLLQITAASITVAPNSIIPDVMEPTPAGGLIGTINAPTAGAQFDFDITTQLQAALAGGTLAVGDYIWVGADSAITGVSPTNIEVGTGPVDVVDGNLDTTLTSVIPEPGSLALLGLGAAALMGRRHDG